LGHGSRFLKLLVAELKIKHIILECEYPIDQDPKERNTQFARIRFYRKNGAEEIDVEYKFPSEEGPMPMILFDIDCKHRHDLNRRLLENTLVYVAKNEDADVEGVDEVLEDVIKSINIE